MKYHAEWEIKTRDMLQSAKAELGDVDKQIAETKERKARLLEQFSMSRSQLERSHGLFQTGQMRVVLIPHQTVHLVGSWADNSDYFLTVCGRTGNLYEAALACIEGEEWDGENEPTWLPLTCKKCAKITSFPVTKPLPSHQGKGE